LLINLVRREFQLEYEEGRQGHAFDNGDSLRRQWNDRHKRRGKRNQVKRSDAPACAMQKINLLRSGTAVMVLVFACGYARAQVPAETGYLATSGFTRLRSVKDDL